MTAALALPCSQGEHAKLRWITARQARLFNKGSDPPMLRIGYTCAAKACNALQKHATWVVNKQRLRQFKAASW
jgi:hypothetical protein